MERHIRVSACLLAVILFFSSLACGRSDKESPVLQPEQQAAAPSTTITPAPEFTPTPAPTPVPEPPYKGDGSTYTYIMTDERDRAWEEDIVYLPIPSSIISTDIPG